MSSSYIPQESDYQSCGIGFIVDQPLGYSPSQKRDLQDAVVSVPVVAIQGLQSEVQYLASNLQRSLEYSAALELELLEKEAVASGQPFYRQ